MPETPNDNDWRQDALGQFRPFLKASLTSKLVQSGIAPDVVFEALFSSGSTKP
jgi:hypothetical protein